MKEYWLSLNTAKKVKLVLSIISLLLIIIFSIQNWDTNEVNFIFFKSKIPTTVIIFVAMSTGFIISSLYNFKNSKKKDAEITELKSKIKAFVNDKGDSL